MDCKKYTAGVTTAAQMSVKWGKDVAYAGGKNAVIHLDVFERISGPFVEEPHEEHKQKEGGGDGSGVKGVKEELEEQVYGAITEKQVRCIISCGPELYKKLTEGKYSTLFTCIAVPQMTPEETKRLLLSLYAPQDRWEEPQLTEKTVDTLIEAASMHNALYKLPSLLVRCVDGSYSHAISYQQRVRTSSRPEYKQDQDQWEQLRLGVGRQIDQARQIKERLFHQWRRQLKDRATSSLALLAKKRLALEYVILPLLNARLREEQKLLTHIPYILDKEKVVTDLQRAPWIKNLLTPAMIGEQKRLFTFFQELHQKAPGRRAEIKAIYEEIALWRMNYSYSEEPGVVIVISGPSGAGKTHFMNLLIKGLDKVFGLYTTPRDPSQERSAFIQFINRINWKDWGPQFFFQRLTGFIKDHPTGTVGLEEFEKTPDGQEAQAQFLQLFGEGSVHYDPILFADNKPAHPVDPIKVKRGNTLFILTSNLGDQELKKLEGQISDDESQSIFAENQKVLTKLLRGKYPEPLIQRIGVIVPFASLPEKAIETHVQETIVTIQRKFKTHHQCEVVLAEGVEGHLLDKIRDEKLEVRLAKRMVNQTIAKPLSLSILEHNQTRDKVAPLKITISVHNGQLEFAKEAVVVL
jgi:ATP-dependent Clp protease ATP-binding subunit ClpA